MELKEFSRLLHNVKNFEQNLSRKFEESTGFSLTRYEILTYLRENSTSLQVDIQRYLKIDQSAVTRHLKILENKGYISRKRNSENNREILVSLTDFAFSEIKKCEDKNDLKICLVDLDIDRDDLNNLKSLLEKININI